jgi:PAS domain-containing protein
VIGRLKSFFAREDSDEKAAGRQEGQSSLLALADAAPCAVLIFQDGHLRYVNPAASAATGLRREEATRCRRASK